MRIGIGIEIGAGVYDAEIEVETEERVVLPWARIWFGAECSSIKLPETIIKAIEAELEQESASIEAEKIQEGREYDGQ